MKAPSVAVVRGVIIASVVSTAIHYTDNYVYVDEYPQPEYINRELIALAWVLLTLVGAAGYLFYRDGKTAAIPYLLVYSYTGLSSLGHYAFGSAAEFTTRMHLMIWLDGLTGAAVAACALWIGAARRRREWVARESNPEPTD